MIKAVVFDVGGVLHEANLNAVVHDISTYFDLSLADLQPVLGPLLGVIGKGAIDEAEFWHRFQTALQTSQPLPPQSLLLAGFKRTFAPNSELLDYTQQLRAQGLATAVLSNTNVVHAEYLRQAGLYDPFDVVVLSHEVHLRKPDPRIYRLTAEKLDVKPDEIILIDDDPGNITAATEQGWRGIVSESTEQVKATLARYLVVGYDTTTT